MNASESDECVRENTDERVRKERSEEGGGDKGGNERVADLGRASLNALPADLWRRIAHAVEEGGECCSSWPLAPSLRRALAGATSLIVEDSCQCQLSSISLAQRIRSFGWLVKQMPELSDLVLTVHASTPPLYCSLVRSVLFPSLSSLTSLTLYLSQKLPPPPRLLPLASPTPQGSHTATRHSSGRRRRRRGERRRRRRRRDDAWRQRCSAGGGNTGARFNDGGRGCKQCRASLRSLELSLLAFSPLVFRFIACLAPMLHSFSLFTNNKFAEQEGQESNGEGGVNGRRTFSLHFPLATFVSIAEVTCSISLSAPLLSSLRFYWSSRHSRLLLLPTCPTPLPALFLQTDHSCPWAFNAPHLTSLDNLRTNILLNQVTNLPPGVISTVRALHWDVQLPPSLDLEPWDSLLCLRLQSWAPVSLATLRSGVVWPCALEGLFLDSIAGDIVEKFKGVTGGGEGDEGRGMGEGDGYARGGGDVSVASGSDPMQVVEGRQVQGEQNQGSDEAEGRRFEVRKVTRCESLRRFEGWDPEEAVLHVWDAAEGISREVGSSPAEGRRTIMYGMERFREAAGIASYCRELVARCLG